MTTSANTRRWSFTSTRTAIRSQCLWLTQRSRLAWITSARSWLPDVNIDDDIGYTHGTNRAQALREIEEQLQELRRVLLASGVQQ